MTGGIAYFLDETGTFKDYLSSENVKVQRVSTKAGSAQLYELISMHAAHTHSSRAKQILENWADYLPQFWQVVPPSEQNSPEAVDAEEMLVTKL
jgi:glutamate synthase (ferredoxin) (EC 1.4.7.1)